MRLIICGGRNLDDHELFHRAITAWIAEHGWPSEVVTGGAMGADAMGKAWAIENGVTHAEFPTDWKTFGVKAGPLRNLQMANYAVERPNGGCLALPGGKGTKNMVFHARTHGLKVMEVSK